MQIIEMKKARPPTFVDKCIFKALTNFKSVVIVSDTSVKVESGRLYLFLFSYLFSFSFLFSFLFFLFLELQVRVNVTLKFTISLSHGHMSHWKKVEGSERMTSYSMNTIY